MFKRIFSLLVVLSLGLSLAGCTFIFQKGRRSDIQKIEELSRQLDELSQAKQLLEDRLSQEIRDKQVQLEMKDKGLVITFLTDILFDSGKAEIKANSFSALDKVARVLQETVPDLKVGIEGHTDNQPIQFSNWKSNWELSTARALSILHYMVDKKGIAPQRVAAIGYGQYQPVASNDTKDGRQSNRRVEIVILPRVSKVKQGASGGSYDAGSNLK
ncbi:MAG: OmpA family protein [Candidatus Omnitrophica bacterium]|nr:OmpA family protein [Candidatus Omnitrophota bacterium]